MDTWTVEQVQSVRVVGNSVAKAIYEANIPQNFRRPQTDSSLEAFIRAKYEHKRYIDKELVPPKADPRDLLTEIENSRKKLSPNNQQSTATSEKVSPNLRATKTSPNPKRKEKKRKSSSGSQKESADVVNSSNLNDLVDLSLDTLSLPGGVVSATGDRGKGSLDDLFGFGDSSNQHHPIRNHSSPFLPSIANNNPPTAVPPNSLNLSPGADGSFGEFSSATLVQQNQTVPVDDSNGLSNEQLLFNAGGVGNASDKKTKNDILALYGSGSNAATTPSMGAPPFVNPAVSGTVGNIL